MTIEPIKNRRSVREYKNDPVSDEDITEIIKAAQFAPAAHSIHAIEFIVVKNQEIKSKLYEISGGDDWNIFIKNAPVILILVATNKAKLPILDLAVASENVFLEAASRELGTVWKNIDEEKAPKIKKLLGIPQDHWVINIIPIGYPKTAPEPKSDNDFDPGKIHPEKW